MDKYRGALKRRSIQSALYGVILAALTVVGCIVGAQRQVPDFMLGFDVGVCLGVEGVLIYYLCKYAAALRSEEKLKALYIAENDERTKYIAALIGGAGLNIIIGGLAAATLIAGFFSAVVFFTLLAALVFTVLVKVVLSLYYSRKV